MNHIIRDIQNGEEWHLSFLFRFFFFFFVSHSDLVILFGYNWCFCIGNNQ